MGQTQRIVLFWLAVLVNLDQVCLLQSTNVMGSGGGNHSGHGARTEKEGKAIDENTSFQTLPLVIHPCPPGYTIGARLLGAILCVNHNICVQ